MGPGPGALGLRCLVISKKIFLFGQGREALPICFFVVWPAAGLNDGGPELMNGPMARALKASLDGNRR